LRGILCFFLWISVQGGLQSSQYFIAIKKNEGGALEHLDVYIPFLPPQDRFYADPFLFKWNGMNYLFFEDYDYKKGVISVVSLDLDGFISKPEVALEYPIHLSFPFVFQDQGEIYMIPETYSLKSISLFQCIAFPNQWKKIKNLIQGERFSDPILFQHDGYYWIFASVHMDRLRIYYAKDLLGKFSPHPVNVLGIQGRNAGSVFSIGRRFIRPVMDCSTKYGKAVIFKEIVLLTPQDFVEKEIGRIDPNWAPNLIGTHSYNQNDDFIVYDGEIKGRSGR
jgi:hypothetical protein